MKMGKLYITATTLSGTVFLGCTSKEDLPEYQLDEAEEYLTGVVDDENIGRLVLWQNRNGDATIFDRLVIPGAILQVCVLKFSKYITE